jgi:hypothetical protein
MYRRLAAVAARLEELGIPAAGPNARILGRAVADGPDRRALRSLLELAQPVTFGQRIRSQVGMTQQTPLTSLVDVARPDPPSRWGSLTLIERYLADSGRTAALSDSLRWTFEGWRAVAPAIQAAAGRVPLAGEGLPAATALARVAEVGLAAMDRLHGGIATTRAWQDSARAVLDSAGQPKGLLRLAVVDAARWLVEVEPVRP